MTAFLQVPAPRGELGEIEDAVTELDRTAEQVADGAAELGHIGASLDADWLGRAADDYARQTLSAQETLASVSTLHQDAARTLQQYAEEWDRAQRASEQGVTDIAEALGSYARDAGDAVGYIVDRLRPLLDSPVGDLLSLVPGVGAIIDRLQSWTAPVAVPEVYTLVEDRVEPVDADDVLSEVQSGLEWGISRLLDGIEAVADLVGDIVGEAIGLFHQVEAALADAIAEAQRLVREALEALFEAGVEAGAALSRLAVDVHRMGREVVTSTVDFLTRVGRSAAELTNDAIEGLLAVGDVGRGLVSGWWPGDDARRRIPAVEAAALDRAADRRLLNDADYQLHVGLMLRLSDWAYDREYGRPHGLEDWEMLERIEGEDGFNASVVRGPTGEVIVTYRGTEPIAPNDWATDVVNAGDVPTSQAVQAIDLAQRVVEEHGAQNVQLTGHSLGGSHASIASLATGRPATTFNAAGVGDGNYQLAMDAGGLGRSQEQITNVHTGNDAVTLAQDLLDVHPAAGAQVDVVSNTHPIGAHGLGAVHDGLDTMGAEQVDERWP